MQGELERRFELAGMTHATGRRLAELGRPRCRKVKIGDRSDAGPSAPRLAETRSYDIERADVPAMAVQQDYAPAAVAETDSAMSATTAKNVSEWRVTVPLKAM